MKIIYNACVLHVTAKRGRRKMGKNPAFQFYPSDWTRDLDDQDLEIEGAWIRICCRLWWSEKRGEAIRPLKEWARILRKTEQKTSKIFQILFEKGIASGSVLDNQNVTIISRRMVRDCEISKIRQEVGRLGGNPGLKKIHENLVNQKPTKTASLRSSSSTSSSLKRKIFIIPSMEEIRAYCTERKNQINPQTFIDHYTGNGWKVGINPMKDWKAVIRTWETRGGNGDGFRDNKRTGTSNSYARRGQPEQGGLGLPAEYKPEDIPDITEDERQRNLKRLADLTR